MSASFDWYVSPLQDKATTRIDYIPLCGIGLWKEFTLLCAVCWCSCHFGQGTMQNLLAREW